jgi:hypothetical protein
MPWRRAALTAVAIAGAVVLCAPAPALAAGLHAPLVAGDIFGTVGGFLGGVFSSIGHAVLGAFTWTISLAANLILTTIAALVRMLIPHSWIHKGVQIMEWIVAVPNYAGQVASPTGAHRYGFAGINQLRDLCMWLGVAVAPLTLVYATSRAILAEREPVAIPVLRVLALAAAIIFYPYLWSQGAALADQVTHSILSLPAVSNGLYKLMEYAVDGVALGGWQLIDLGLMGAIALELLALIFMKVVIILLGALLYATGPLMIGLVATEAGASLARAWASAVAMLLGLGICWAAMFAVGALLIGDAGTAGPLIAGNSTFGTLIGGLLLAVAGLASLWLCLKVAKEAGSLLRMQLAGLLVLSRRASSSNASTTSAAPSRLRTTGQSLREYGARLGRAAAGAGGELAAAVPGGGAMMAGGRAVGQVGRRGILGTAAAGARSGATQLAPRAEVLLGRSRAGAVAARMARAGTAGWKASPAPATPSRANGAGGKPAAPASGNARKGDLGGATVDRRHPERATSSVPPASRVSSRARDGRSATRTPVGLPPTGARRSPGTPSAPSTAPGGEPAGRPVGPAAVPPRSNTRSTPPPSRSPGRPANQSKRPPNSKSAAPPAPRRRDRGGRG